MVSLTRVLQVRSSELNKIKNQAVAECVRYYTLRIILSSGSKAGKSEEALRRYCASYDGLDDRHISLKACSATEPPARILVDALQLSFARTGVMFHILGGEFDAWMDIADQVVSRIRRSRG